MPKGEIPWLVRCGAKRRNGLPCKKWAMRGCKRCRLHGGLTLGAQAKAPERLARLAEECVLEAIAALKAQLVNPRTTAPVKREIAESILDYFLRTQELGAESSQRPSEGYPESHAE